MARFGGRRVRRVVAALAAWWLMTMVLWPASVAQADDVIRHQPYMDVLNFENLRKLSLDGTGVKIGLIDGRANTAMPELAGANITNKGFCSAANEGISGHGSSVLSLMASKDYGWSPKAAYTVYSHPLGQDGKASSLPADCKDKTRNDFLLNQALNDRMDLVVITTGAEVSEGPGFTYAVIRAHQLGVPIIAATGNDGFSLSMDAALNNGVVGVGMCDLKGGIVAKSNFGKGLTVLAPGVQTTIRDYSADGRTTSTRVTDGTSLAAPMVAGALALVKQKYPKVKGNQLIQLLVKTARRSSGSGWSEDVGYGVMSAKRLLEEDPTALPDANPLMEKGEYPSPKEISDFLNGEVQAMWLHGNGEFIYRGDSEIDAKEFPPERRAVGTSPRLSGKGATSPGPTNSGQEARGQAEPSGIPWWVLAGGVAGVVLVAAVAVVLVLRSRKTSPSD